MGIVQHLITQTSNITIAILRGFEGVVATNVTAASTMCLFASNTSEALHGAGCCVEAVLTRKGSKFGVWNSTRTENLHVLMEVLP